MNSLWLTLLFLGSLVVSALSNCQGEIDVVVVLDESGSIGDTNFPFAVKFVGELMATFEVPDARIGYLTFDSVSRPIFDLNNQLTAQEIQDQVAATVYHGRRTATGDAIQAALDMFTKTPQRNSEPRIMIVITDGETNEGTATVAGMMPLINAAGIKGFAVGIGQNLNMAELNLISDGDKNRLVLVPDYASLPNFTNFAMDACYLVSPSTTTSTTPITTSTTTMAPPTTAFPTLPPQQNCPAVSDKIQCYLNSLQSHVAKINIYLEEIRAANPYPCSCTNETSTVILLPVNATIPSAG